VNTQTDLPPPDDATAALLTQRLGELDRLRGIGMEKARMLDGAVDGLSSVEMVERLSGRHGIIGEFDRIARAVRQVIVLELELRGLIPAVNREVREEKDDETLFSRAGIGLERELSDYQDDRTHPDYRRGPLHAVIAGVRTALDVKAPEDDPFSAEAELRASGGASASLRPSPIAGEEGREVPVQSSKTLPLDGERPGEGGAALGNKRSPKPANPIPAPRRPAAVGRLMASTAPVPMRLSSPGLGGRGPPGR